ncbi:hypothetical protein AGR4C_Cc160057 [Agrobacterium tumefaciens str. Kerr 14]|uniref:Uncharacterized protein n=1 Tax=Agrobacterium tumefaciens str. Kerr 14 TaxID=1183424 RepID=A0A1S7P4R2_AGRTU|nr:hypothetical protein AGR4C_Cc160057 [Agrobacterium tumefaciens str. Kerr 14]
MRQPVQKLRTTRLILLMICQVSFLFFVDIKFVHPNESLVESDFNQM